MTTGRNTELLASVSSKFTVETLWDILRKSADKDDVEVIDWEFEAATAKGCNYLSVVHRVTIVGSVGGDHIRLPIFVKALPPSQSCRKTFRSAEFFRNEITFYSKVVPAFENFLRCRGQLRFLNIPKCLAYFLDGENDFLVLEDITTKGFKHTEQRQNTWKAENCKVILKGLAQFHGTALAFNRQNPEKFSEITKDLTEVFFDEKYWSWYGNYYTNMNAIAKTAMRKEYGDTPEEKKFCDITPYQLFEKCVKCCKRRDTSLVVNHGDSWAFNFMTRTEASGDEDAVIFDFQLTRVASPILDISYFIYTSTDKETRDEHFSDLLEYYHSEIGNVISTLGFNVDDVYPRQLFMTEVKEMFGAGAVFAVDIMPIMLAPDSELCDLDELEGDDPVDLADIWQANPDPPQENQKRIADVVVHAIQQGFL